MCDALGSFPKEYSEYAKAAHKISATEGFNKGASS
jgi:hypothetical protein